jgi:FAD/FMN-containing dehydrogenase
LEARVRLVASPPSRSLVVLGYPNIYRAADHVPEILEYKPIACVAIDFKLVENMRLKGMHSGDLEFLPEGHGWLLLEFGGESREVSDDHANRLLRALKRRSDTPTSRLYDDPEQEQLIWKTSRGWSRRNRAGTRREADLGRMGGLCGPACQAGQLSARFS